MDPGLDLLLLPGVEVVDDPAEEVKEGRGDRGVRSENESQNTFLFKSSFSSRKINEETLEWTLFCPLINILSQSICTGCFLKCLTKCLTS